MRPENAKTADQHMCVPHGKRRRQIDLACRFPLTQPDDLERAAGRGRASTRGGAIKSRHIDQIRIGANNGP